MARPDPVPLLDHAGPLLAGYDVLLCDVWGVVHDGLSAFPAAEEALLRFRRGGGTVILVSNAPVPGHGVALMLDRVGLRRDAYDAIVSSGDVALAHIAERGYQRVFCIGPADRDAGFFSRLSAVSASIEDADAVVCTGLNDDANERAETYRPLLEGALARRLPFVCVNPDLVVAVGDRLFPCAGAIAALYEAMGGTVFWAGKPDPVSYEAALAAAERLRPARVDRSRVLAVGDSVRTDLGAAANAGVDAVFIASGIHHEELWEDDTLSIAKLERLLASAPGRPVAAMSQLRW